MKTFLFASLLGVSTFLACGEKEAPYTRKEGTVGGDCSDGADNDDDGAFDCLDDGCADSPDCIEDKDTGTVEDTNIEDTDTEDTNTTDDTDTQDTDTEDTNVEEWWINEPDGYWFAYFDTGFVVCMLFPNETGWTEETFSIESLEYTEAVVGSDNVYNADVCFSDITPSGRCMLNDLSGFDFTHTVYLYATEINQGICESSEDQEWVPFE